jgi:hypothetical protein
MKLLHDDPYGQGLNPVIWCAHNDDGDDNNNNNNNNHHHHNTYIHICLEYSSYFNNYECTIV